MLDPLSKEIACDCVSGYAQRDYEKLGAYLQTALKRPVAVVFSESMTVAVKEKASGRADIVIGKDSVVRSDAKSLGIGELEPVVALTDKQGVTTMRGLFIVRNDNPAASLLDIDGYQILFGPEKCDEKFKAPKATLKKMDVDVADEAKSCETCSVAAKELVALPKDNKLQPSFPVMLWPCWKVAEREERRLARHRRNGYGSLHHCFASRSLPDSQRQELRGLLCWR